MITPFKNIEVKKTFESYPENMREKLFVLRELIFKTAKKGNLSLEETLKWGEPSYLPLPNNIGTTVRIAWKPSFPTQYNIYFNCKTTLVEDFKKIFGPLFCYEGNRSIVFEESDSLPIQELSDCISMALTYHLRKIKK